MAGANCDFGLSRIISHTTRNMLTNQVGTFYYMSPEVADTTELQHENATAIDIYSFGIIMWQLLFQFSDPYMNTDKFCLKKLRVTNAPDYKSIFQLCRYIAEGLRPAIPFHTIQECTEWCEEYIPELSEAQVRILFDMVDLLQQCWAHNPNQRPTIQFILLKLNSWEK